jgi:hypothetical protein
MTAKPAARRLTARAVGPAAQDLRRRRPFVPGVTVGRRADRAGFCAEAAGSPPGVAASMFGMAHAFLAPGPDRTGPPRRHQHRPGP